ncbi:MAG: site-2 protease family protein [Planctomycetaceae bacterium]
MTADRQQDTDDIPVIVPSQIEVIDNRETGDDPQFSPRTRQRREKSGNRWRWPVGLFIATCISTFFAGMVPGAGAQSFIFLREVQPELLAQLIGDGAKFSGAVMLILLFHEMGHYLQARRHGISATFPYFIPMPFTPFGTMGAVIFQEPGAADRRQMFDIAVSGPLAGLIMALPIAYMGVQQSVIDVIPANSPSVQYGDPLVLRWLIELKHGPLADNQDVMLDHNPLLFAGWVGIFITALNLIPIGQLDGGHILYTLIGKRARRVAILLAIGSFFYMLMTGNHSYMFMWFLIVIMGTSHPPTADDTVPLGPLRTAIGWITLAFICIGFTPMPLTIH